MAKLDSKEARATIWRFLRQGLCVADFEAWLYQHKELEEILGAGLHLDAISVNFASAEEVEHLRNQLVAWAAGTQPTECLCNLLKDVDMRALGHDANLFLSKLQCLARRTPWIELWRCRECRQDWLVGTDTVDDDVSFERVDRLVADGIVGGGEWPELKADSGNLWPDEGWFEACGYRSLEHWLEKEDDEQADPMNAANLHSLNHRSEVFGSSRCGCYFCLTTFKPMEIRKWEDWLLGPGRTAVCPSCGTTAVVGNASGLQVDEVGLRRMRDAWFPGMRDREGGDD